MKPRQEKKCLKRWARRAKENMDTHPLSGSAYREYVVATYCLAEYLYNVKRSKEKAKTA